MPGSAELPQDPFALLPGPRPGHGGATLRREGRVFGAPVEIVLLPLRAQRQGVPGPAPGPARPPFPASRADAIVSREAVWRDAARHLALTPNAFPFGAPHAVLWTTQRRREPPLDLLVAAFEIEESTAGTAIGNSIGAAASIARSHLHLLGETQPFLGQLPREVLAPERLGLDATPAAGCRLYRLAPQLGVSVIGVEGTAARRAQVVHDLLVRRSTAAFNLVGSGGITWILPRSAVEVPAPHFPQALGGAEFWGRWCCETEATFHALTTADMESAIRLAGIPG